MKLKFIIFFNYLIVLLNIISPLNGDNYQKLRDKMVTEQIENRGIKNKDVLKSMRMVQRDLFVPQDIKNFAKLKVF